MSTPLGEIQKPEAEQYRKGRKLYLVPMFAAPLDSPPDLKPESTEGRPWGQPLKKAAGAPLNLG